MKILITGCEGQLGKELTHLLSNNYHYQITATTKKDLDICSFEIVDEFIQRNNFDVVINCAAYTKVDLCEINKETAFSINALGAKNLAISCNKIDAKIVYVSTDYVFDGSSGRPYVEYDSINPLSIYGKSKALGESFTQNFSSKYFIVRTAWLYGDGNNFIKTMVDLSKNKDSINVVCDQIGTPTSVKDLANCIIQLIHTQNYGIYHATCNGECSWYEFACKIFELLNIDIQVNPIVSKDFNSATPRPQYSTLDNFMLSLNNLNNFRNWEDALKDYISLHIKI